MIKKLINDLTDNKISVSAALKRSKLILPIKNDDLLKDFIKYELEGHTDDSFPDYRKVIGQPFGNYKNNFSGATMQVPINFDQFNFSFNFNERQMFTSIVEIESFIEQVERKDGEIKYTFTPGQMGLLYKYTNATNDNGWFMESAYWTIQLSDFKRIYSKTQDVLIDHLIRILTENPDIEKELGYINMDEPKASANINTTIHGNVTGSNLGFGESVVQKDVNITNNAEINEVLQKILELGFDKTDTEELKTILAEKQNPDKSFGKGVLNWIGKMASKAVEKGIESKIPELTAILSQYL